MDTSLQRVLPHGQVTLALPRLAGGSRECEPAMVHACRPESFGGGQDALLKAVHKDSPGAVLRKSDSRPGIEKEVGLKLQRMIAILSLLLCGLVPLWGQLYTGSVSGVVRDPSGAVVPNVKVTLTDVAKNYAYTATTGTTGNYSAPAAAEHLHLEARGSRIPRNTNTQTSSLTWILTSTQT